MPLAVLLLAALSACAAPVIVPGPDGSGDTCGLAELASFLGQPASVLDAARFAVPVRVIRPGDAVTEDFNPARVNFRIDEGERIEAITCG
jgi:hypothetical protein